MIQLLNKTVQTLDSAFAIDISGFKSWHCPLTICDHCHVDKKTQVYINPNYRMSMLLTIKDYDKAEVR